MNEAKRAFREDIAWLRKLSKKLGWSFCDVLIVVAGKPYPTISPLEMLNAKLLEKKLIDHYWPRFLENECNRHRIQWQEVYSEDFFKKIAAGVARRHGSRGGRPKGGGNYAEPLIDEAIAPLGLCATNQDIIDWIRKNRHIELDKSTVSRYVKKKRAASECGR